MALSFGKVRSGKMVASGDQIPTNVSTKTNPTPKRRPKMAYIVHFIKDGVKAFVSFDNQRAGRAYRTKLKKMGYVVL